VKKPVVTRAQKRRMGVDGIRRCERESTVERSGRTTWLSVIEDPFRWGTWALNIIAWEAGFSVPSQAENQVASTSSLTLSPHWAVSNLV